MPPDTCNDIDRRLDRIIGQRIRQRRDDWGIAQKALADALNITQGQLRKYETAQNRIAASTLFDVAHHLQMPIAWFFEEEDG